MGIRGDLGARPDNRAAETYSGQEGTIIVHATISSDTWERIATWNRCASNEERLRRLRAAGLIAEEAPTDAGPLRILRVCRFEDIADAYGLDPNGVYHPIFACPEGDDATATRERSSTPDSAIGEDTWTRIATWYESASTTERLDHLQTAGVVDEQGRVRQGSSTQPTDENRAQRSLRRRRARRYASASQQGRRQARRYAELDSQDCLGRFLEDMSSDERGDLLHRCQIIQLPPNWEQIVSLHGSATDMDDRLELDLDQELANRLGLSARQISQLRAAGIHDEVKILSTLGRDQDVEALDDSVDLRHDLEHVGDATDWW